MSRLELKKEYAGESARLVCRGRITAGGEAEALNTALSELLLEVPAIELDLEHVSFLDSSGIGVLVRQLVRARAKGKQLRIGAISPQARKTLEATNVLAQFRKFNPGQMRLRSGLRLLFVHPSAEIRTFVAALLKDRGAAPSTCAGVYDARMLGGADNFELLIIASDLDASSIHIPKKIALPPDFFAREADVASEELIMKIVSLFHAASA